METSQITFGDLSFDINKPFARGAISTDHLGKWNGNQVIFKVILDTLDENIVDEILKEFDILSRYRHQNIVVFYGVSSELSGPPVIVSEHADCGSLASYIKKYPQSINGPKVVNHILTQIALGMAYLHSQFPPIIHGDLKAANCLLHSVKNGLEGATIKIADYGMSRIKSLTETSQTKGSVSGTLRWMAPERLEGGELSEAVDVYAFSMTGYEIITIGKVPFELNDFDWTNDFAIMTALYKQVRPTRPPVTSVPLYDEEHWELLVKCWNQNPTERPTFSMISRSLSTLKTKCEVSSAPSSSVTSNPSTTTKTILDDDNQFLIEPSEATPVERVKRSLKPIDMSDQIRKLDKEYEEGTRQWFVNDILKWIECNKSRTLWITGGAGTGKTIVSHLISLTIPTACFGTVFYCSRSDPARSDVSKILKTIAYDLSTKFPMYFKYLLDLVNKDERFVLKGNPSVINSPPLKLAKFLLTGGFKFMEGSTERLVIIIDGIDEIDNTSQRNDLLAIIKNAAFNLPSFVRLIVAGRLMNELWDQLSQVDIRVLEPTSDHNMADLRTFIRPRLDDMGIYIPDDLDKATDELARKVNGVFGYAKNALESMQLENLHDIEDLLMSINSLTPDLCQTCDFSELQRVISTVTAIRIPLSLSGVLQLLDLPKPHAARIVSVLMKLFRTENSAIIERYFSIISGLDASFGVNLEDVEARLADFCFRVLLAELRFNMANIHESYQYNFHDYIPNFNKKVSSIPEHIRYAATYATVHIESAMKRTIPDHYATQLNSTISSILSTKLTYWIELHSLTGSGSSAVEVMFRQILSFIETYTGTISVDAKSKSLVENALLIVERFYTPISSCAFQVYWTVLPFSATDSVFREMYWESRPIGKYPKLLKDVEYSKLENFSAAQTLTGHTDWVWPVGIIDLNQRRRILTGSGDKTVKIWEASTGKLVQTLTGHNNMVYSIAVSADGQRIISGSSAGHIKMWRSSDGNLLQDLNGHTNAVYSLVFSKDGSCFVSGSSDKSIIVWDSNRGTTMKVLLGHTNCVASVAISNDGRRIASGSWDKTIKIWDMKSGAELRTLSGHTNMVWSVQFLNDGVRLVSASEDTTIKIWNLDSGVELRTLTGHTGCVRSVALSSGGHRIVSGSYDQTVRIWDLEAGKLIRTLTGHSKFVLGVVISDDGLQIVSGSQDNTAKIWNLELTQSMLMEEMDDVGDYSKLWANNGLNSKKGKAVTANLQNSNKYLLNAEGWICSDDIKLFWLPFKATGEIMWVSKGRLAIRFESKALIIDISDFDSPPVNSDATLRNDSTLNHFRTSSYNSYVEIPYPKVSSPTSVSNEPSTPIVSSSATSSDERARQMDKNSDKKKIFKFF